MRFRNLFLDFDIIGICGLLLLCCFGCSGSGDDDALADGGLLSDGGGEEEEDTEETNTGEGDLLVWTQMTSRKIQPSAVPSTNTTVDLAGPRISYQSYQIAIHAQTEGLRGVQAVASDLTGTTGAATIAAANVTLFRQYYIDFTGTDEVAGGNEPVPFQSPTNDGRVGDPLIPLVCPYTGKNVGQPFAVTANENQGMWVDVYIPPGTPADTYTGQITITDSRGQSAVVPIQLEVWDLDLPDLNSYTTYFIFRMENLVKYHRDTADCYDDGNCWMGWDEYSRSLVKRYSELAHNHRIDPGLQYTQTPPQSCEPPINWGPYDQSVAPFMDGSHWADGVPSNRMTVYFMPGNLQWGIGAGCTKEEYVELARVWAAHLKEKGWFDRVQVFAVDEPPPSKYEDIILHAGWMIEGDPDWKDKIMVTLTPTFEVAEMFNSYVGRYVVNPPRYSFTTDPNSVDSNYHAYGRFTIDELFDQGIDLWFYESCSSRPNNPTFATNTLDGAEPQMLLWGSWYERATGFMFWAINHWILEDPWGPAIDVLNKSGDGVLIYPGHHDGLMAPVGSPSDVELDGPVPSYRLKMIRTGLQDWALFGLADKLNLADYARQQVAQVYGQFGGCTYVGCADPISGFYWETDEVRMNQIRADIANAIIQAQ